MAQFHEHDLVANKFMDKKHMDKVLQKSSYKTEEALFAAIGFGEIGAITIFNRLTEDERREEERAKARAEAEELVKGGEVKVENKKDTLKVRHEGGVVIQGASGLLIRIAKCCNPVPGDEIVGLHYQRTRCCDSPPRLYEPTCPRQLRATIDRCRMGR